MGKRKGVMSIETAIRKALSGYSIGDSVGRIQLTKRVSSIRGIPVEGESVGRILRYMHLAGTIKYTKVRGGVFELQEKNYSQRKSIFDALVYGLNIIHNVRS